MAIPAYLMDKALASRIKKLEEQMVDVTEWIHILNDQYKKMEEKIKKNKETIETEIGKDVHEHVRKLVEQIHALENEIKTLKQ